LFWGIAEGWLAFRFFFGVGECIGDWAQIQIHIPGDTPIYMGIKSGRQVVLFLSAAHSPIWEQMQFPGTALAPVGSTIPNRTVSIPRAGLPPEPTSGM
jgi:hypothetical protein